MLLLRWAALAALATAVAGTRSSAGCGSAPKLVTANSTQMALTTMVNNKTRQYFVKLPDNYDNKHAYRLVFTLHALKGSAQQVVAGTGGYLPWYGLPPLVNDSLGAVFVAPDGLNNGWANIGGEDITFISNVMHTLGDDLCVDESLRFSTGFSYGAAMSYSVACSLGKDFRAVAALSGNPVISGCNGSTNDPVAYYGQHGVSDEALPISGGRSMRDRFLKLNGCSTADAAEEPAAGSGTHTRTVYKGCAPDKPVVWVAFDGPHTAQPKDKNATATFSNTETWEFFSQFK